MRMFFILDVTCLNGINIHVGIGKWDQMPSDQKLFTWELEPNPSCYHFQESASIDLNYFCAAAVLLPSISLFFHHNIGL